MQYNPESIKKFSTVVDCLRDSVPEDEDSTRSLLHMFLKKSMNSSDCWPWSHQTMLPSGLININPLR